MDQKQTRTIGFLCPKCRQSVLVEKDLFALTAAPVVVPCPCGGSRLIVEYNGRQFKLIAPCVSCGRSHTVTCSESDFRQRRGMAFACKHTGLDCCFVGEEGVVVSALQRLEQRVDQMGEDTAQKGAFLNEVVMTEVMGELKEIAQRGGISCTCGSKEWNLDVHYASVEVICAACGNSLRLPAATLDDLDDLCCKNELLIRGK
jgi:hypothetical protein